MRHFLSDLFSALSTKLSENTEINFLKKTPSVQVDKKTDDEQNPTYVITVSREYGSGGRQIAKALAESLGFKYYDNELINLLLRRAAILLILIEKE